MRLESCLAEKELGVLLESHLNMSQFKKTSGILAWVSNSVASRTRAVLGTG